MVHQFSRAAGHLLAIHVRQSRTFRGFHGTTSIHHQELNRQLLNSAKSGDIGQASMALQVTGGDRRTGIVGLAIPQTKTGECFGGHGATLLCDMSVWFVKHADPSLDMGYIIRFLSCKYVSAWPPRKSQCEFP